MTKKSVSYRKATKSDYALRRVLLLVLVLAMLILLSVVLTGKSNGQWPFAVHAQIRETATTFLEIYTPTSQKEPLNLTAGGAQTSSKSEMLITNTSTPTNPPTVTLLPTSTQTPLPSPLAPKTNPPQEFPGTIFLSINEGGYSHLFAYHPTSLGLTRLTNGPWDDITPATSPDGAYLAFASNRDGQWDLYLLDFATGDINRLTNTPEYDASPSWSPDGQWLVHESYALGTPSLSQELVENNGTTPTSSLLQEPSFELFSSLDLLIRPVNLANSGEEEIIRLTSDPGAEYAPVWSPTGRQIAFVSAKNGDHEIWLADLDRIDDRFRNVSHNPATPDQYPAWSAQGTTLAWSRVVDDMQIITVQDDPNMASKPRPIGGGNRPTWDPSGKILLTVFSSPNRNYLTGYSIDDSGLIIPPVALPGPVNGLYWAATSIPTDLPSNLAQVAQITPTPSWKSAISPLPDSPGGRHRVVQLEEVEAPYPMLHDLVDEPFYGLRNHLALKLGWDYLTTLENAFVPLTTPLFPGMLDDWLYTGRAIALNPAPINANWMLVAREQFGSEIYWRVFIRTRFQDGSQGSPLTDFPWEFSARYSGNPRYYEQGGAAASEIPAGYWLDFTELALSLRWERLPALSSWRMAYNAARHNEFVFRQGIDWLTAMEEIYPPSALATPTKVIPPTHTPTATRWPTRTPTPTRTPWPTRTPTTTSLPPTPTP